MNTKASILCENVLTNLYLDIIYLLKLIIFLKLCSHKAVCILEQINVCGQISGHIFVPNRGYCLYIFLKKRF